MHSRGRRAGRKPTVRASRARSDGPHRTGHRNSLRELIVGLLTHGLETWSWALTGVPPPDDADFVWHGEVRSEDAAFDQLEFAWTRWVWWAGLEAVAPLYRC